MKEADFFLDSFNPQDLINVSEFRDLIYADHEHIAVLEMLLEYTEDIKERDSQGATLLYSILLTFIERNRTFFNKCGDTISVNSIDADGRTPLHYTAALDKPAIIGLLAMEYNTDIQVKNDWKATPLHYSVKSIDCTMSLIDYGVDINVQDCFGRTALHYAVLVEDSNERVEKILSL